MRWLGASRQLGLCACVLLACGGETAKPPPYRAPEPPPTDVELALARAMCGYLQRCEPDSMGLVSEASVEACEYQVCTLTTYPTGAGFDAMSVMRLTDDTARKHRCPWQ